MFEELPSLKIQFATLSTQLSDPAVLANLYEYIDISKKYSHLEKIINKYDEYIALDAELEAVYGALNALEEPEMISYFTTELNLIRGKRENAIKQLKYLLNPSSTVEQKNVLLEIRAGAGGEEAALFAEEILAMYIRYAETQKWSVTLIDDAESNLGGSKNATILIEGENAYAKLKNESGVHRVQRVPQTESSGRVHSSTITVAILEETESIELNIDMSDIRVDTFCATGPGGQGTNTTYSAVRLTHLPSGLVVSCQDGRSQIKNKEQAMRVLSMRLRELENQKQHKAVATERRQQIGTGDRSEKIRTYNFKENRVTDHRVNYTTHQLESFLNGKIDELIDILMHSNIN